MTAPNPVGFLDFFILEASDYVEQLDSLLDGGGASGPDPDGLQRVARALRGSATMAKLLAFADVAAGIERVGRNLREGALRWDAGLNAVVVAAVDDCKLLLRSVRSWSEAEDARAHARVAELTQYAPLRSATPLVSPNMQGHDSYLATEASNIGAGLELLATRPGDRDAATNVLRRVRALRGIASVKDHPALADVLEAAEQAAHPLELGGPTLSAERIALLAAAATVLRGVASAIRGGGSEAPTADVARFANALDALQERETDTERIVPIAELFYDNGGATIVSAAANPPTTRAERFRLEAVGQGEHLRRLVSDARAARDDLARERVRRGLRQALRSLKQTAESFGEKEVADLVTAHESDVVDFDVRALASLDDVATLLAQPGSSLSSIGSRVSAPAAPRGPEMTPIRPTAVQPSAAPQERVVPAVAELAAAVRTTAAQRPSTPAARLGELLDNGIKALGSLGQTPLGTKVVLADQPPVPIDVLLYRGRGALQRCVEIRDQARKGGGPIETAALDELFDLLDLALTD
jgi:chemotaxis protein histidine kinase CheA